MNVYNIEIFWQHFQVPKNQVYFSVEISTTKWTNTCKQSTTKIREKIKENEEKNIIGKEIKIYSSLNHYDKIID